MSPDSGAELELVSSPDLGAPLTNGEFVEVNIRYSPANSAGSDGTLEVRYEYVNADGAALQNGEQLLPVPVFGRRPTPQIAVNPESLIFGAIDEGTESEPMTLLISNVGLRPLEISSIAFSLLDADDNDQFELRDLPELDGGPTVLQPEEFLSIQVVYRPTEASNHAATLQIRSNSAQDGTKLVQVTGRVRRPCIEIIPGEINLGIVALNIESLHSNAQITNCGDLPVEVSDIQITGGDAGFQWSPVEEAWNGNTSIPPLGSYPIEVWYTNQSLGEGQTSEAQLRITNNTPDQPNIEVPLSVIGGGAPTCDLLILPSRVDFGLVARGRNVTRQVEILNRGTGYCELRAQEIVPALEIPIPIPGFNEVRFFITRNANLGQIAPSARVPMEITYRPQTFSADGGKLRLTYQDPYENTEKLAEPTFRV